MAAAAQEDDTTRDVYESTVQSLVKGAIDGFNGTVFAYGQTGSGKTHTIVGKKSEPGILIMAAEDLFSAVSKVCAAAARVLPRQALLMADMPCHVIPHQAKSEGRGAYVIRVGMLEIYNEEMKDLAMATQAQRLHQGEFGTRLQIKEDPVLGIKVRRRGGPRSAAAL